MAAASSNPGTKNDSIENAIPVRVRKGLRNAASLLSQLWTEINEFVLGIRTEPERQADRIAVQGGWKGTFSKDARHDDNFIYVTISYRNIQRVLRYLKPRPEDVFYDIGSGMGRVLCVVARKDVRKCVGVELLEPLCQIARRNSASLRGRKAPIQIISGDATTADLAEGTIYFLFNPFGPETLRHTLENIRCSLSQKPRAIKVVYYNSVFQSVLEGLPWLRQVHEFESSGGHRVTFWENAGSEDGRAVGGVSRERRQENPRASQSAV